MPHPYTPRRSGEVWGRIVFAEVAFLDCMFGVLTVAAPHPWNWLAAAFLVMGLFPLSNILHTWARGAHGNPHVTHPLRVAHDHNPASDHLPFLLIAPLGLLLVFAITSPWAHVAYPIILGTVLLGSLVLPWLRKTPKRAPPLHRALAGGSYMLFANRR